MVMDTIRQHMTRFPHCYDSSFKLIIRLEIVFTVPEQFNLFLPHPAPVVIDVVAVPVFAVVTALSKLYFAHRINSFVVVKQPNALYELPTRPTNQFKS